MPHSGKSPIRFRNFTLIYSPANQFQEQADHKAMDSLLA